MNIVLNGFSSFAQAALCIVLHATACGPAQDLSEDKDSSATALSGQIDYPSGIYWLFGGDHQCSGDERTRSTMRWRLPSCMCARIHIPFSAA